MRYLTLAALAFALTASSTGCGITGCDEVERTVEVEYGSSFEEFQRGVLETYRDRGFDCSNSEAIRNAFGNVIGRRYTCTGCDD